MTARRSTSPAGRTGPSDFRSPAGRSNETARPSVSRRSAGPVDLCSAGVEPATSAFGGRRSIQLSYEHVFFVISTARRPLVKDVGRPDRVTRGQGGRRPCYPWCRRRHSRSAARDRSRPRHARGHHPSTRRSAEGEEPSRLTPVVARLTFLLTGYDPPSRFRRRGRLVLERGWLACNRLASRYDGPHSTALGLQMVEPDNGHPRSRRRGRVARSHPSAASSPPRPRRRTPSAKGERS